MKSENLSDTQIRSNLRGVLTKHSIDMSKTQFVCAKGIVRMLGELQRQGQNAGAPITPTQLEALEHEIGATRGVKRVHYDLRNFQRAESGHWRPIEGAISKRKQSEARSASAEELY